METIKMLGQLRAAGSQISSAYNALKDTIPGVTEEQLLAAEKAAGGTLPVDAPPIIVAPPVPTPAPTAAHVERFPGVFYTPDLDPTRGDIMDGQDLTKLPLFRFVDAGYNVTSFGPINRKWKTNSMYAPVFGKGRNAIWDGCNGRNCVPPQPEYSPAGWPIHYTVDDSGGRDGFGSPIGKVIGTGSLMYDDKAFNNDAEVAEYIAAKLVSTPPAPPGPTPHDLKASYPGPNGRGALVADCVGFAYAVMLDAAQIHTGFGPADQYITQADGGVTRGRYVAPVNPQVTRRRGTDGLYDSYQSIQALVDDAKACNYQYAIVVDDLGVWPGFGPPVLYRAVANTVQR